jgi:hypothetical protein
VEAEEAMSNKKKEPTDTTRGGLKVPVPTRKAFFDSLEKVSRPEPEEDEMPGPNDGRPEDRPSSS